MENFKVKVKDFGKLANADIRIGRFTVFAGRNSTGKSFMSKALYSIFGASNVNHLAVVLSPPVERLRSRIRWLSDYYDASDQSENFTMFAKAVENLRQLIDKIPIEGDMDEYSAVGDAFPQISQLINEIGDAFSRFTPELQKIIESGAHAAASPRARALLRRGIRRSIFDEDDLQRMSFQVNSLLSMKENQPDDLIEIGLQMKIERNFLGNFLVGDLSSLCRGGSVSASFEVEGVGNFNIASEECRAEISHKGLHSLQKHSRVLYLESPVFWRLKDALDAPELSISARNQPRYFRDMMGVISGNYPKPIRFPDILGKLTAEIGGRVVTNETNDLMFEEKGGDSHPLPLSAMGIANFGMLGLLIEKNRLDENTILFIDEPEAHLHPAWQVAMAETLFALAEGGVNVVIATHSAEILKWLEVKVKESPEAEETIALNHFKDGTVECNGKGFTERLDAIQEDLADPYYRLFYRGMS